MKELLILVCLGVSIGSAAQTQGKPAVKMGGPAAQAQKTQVQVDPVASLQAQVRVMRAQIQELKRQIDMLVRDSQTAKANVPHCSADLQTSSSAQGSRQCSPYACDQVVGTCLMSCATTNDCNPGAVCDVGAARCVTVP
jgi:hypothetical protein